MSSSKHSNNNINKPAQTSQHHRTRSEITRSLLQQAQRKATKFERAPFDPSATISYFETEQEHRVTPRRNYRGVAEENPTSYFEFPVPTWVPASQAPKPSNNSKGIMSLISQCTQRGMAMEREGPPLPPLFPDLQIAKATSLRPPPTDANQSQRVVTKEYEEYNFHVTREQQGDTRDEIDDDLVEPVAEELPSVIIKAYSRRNSGINNSVPSLAAATCFGLVVECEERERKLIEEHSRDLHLHCFVQRQKELRNHYDVTDGSIRAELARQKYDKAMGSFIGDRLNLIGNTTNEMVEILWGQFDLSNVNSLLYTLLQPSSQGDDNEDDEKEEDEAKRRRKNVQPSDRPLAKKDQTAEMADMETRLAELETLLSWNKFERRRLEDILRQETAEAFSARATRDAALQQLAALEAECVPLLKGMNEIFGAYDDDDGQSRSNNNNNNSNYYNSSMAQTPTRHSSMMMMQHSILGSFLNGVGEASNSNKGGGKTALERVADQIEQSPFHVHREQQQQQQQTGSGDGTAPPFAAEVAGGDDMKKVLESLDRETLASMILLERQLSQRMLIGAKSQVYAEVEAQKRFVDTSILLKKQAAHSMFLVDLFQHRLPQLRRACSALGNVVHKFENSCSTAGVPRHKSNVVSRHNLGCSVADPGGSGPLQQQQQPQLLTHSALVAYSKSLVAHVGALLRWLDTEAGN